LFFFFPPPPCAGVCASDGELMMAMAQAASASETIERMVSSRLKLLLL
jgi:hypothetical protein